jgi:aldose 1-epimerase
MANGFGSVLPRAAFVFGVLGLAGCAPMQGNDAVPVQSLTQTDWGTASSGGKVTLFTLKNGRLEARVTNYGAVLVDLMVPDRAGHEVDIVEGFGSLSGYTDPAFVKGGGYMGATIGRFANRIAGARFALDGKSYGLARNNGPNQLHGGPDGFNRRVWTATAQGGASVTFALTSPDGDQGFPGTLQVSVKYTLEAHALRIDYAAATDKPTVVNLTNHSYFNLGGAVSGAVLGTRLQIFAHGYTVAGADRIPTGEIAPVAGTALDFTSPKPIGADIDAADIVAYHGYDHNFVLDGVGLKRAARAQDPVSGRAMEVWTTEPGMQLYVAPDKPGFVGREGKAYPPRGAFCLETQHFPDSPNESAFPSTEVTPDKPFRSTTIFRFSEVP